jgi:hypothetical protein
VFFFPLQKHCNGACSPHSSAPWTYWAVWLKGHSEFSNSFDAPIQWRVRVMYLQS